MKFKVYPDRRRQWRWALVAGNGRILADSGQGYLEKRHCYEGIDLIKAGVPGADTYEELIEEQAEVPTEITLDLSNEEGA